jgi:hypothetical protein
MTITMWRCALALYPTDRDTLLERIRENGLRRRMRRRRALVTGTIVVVVLVAVPVVSLSGSDDRQPVIAASESASVGSSTASTSDSTPTTAGEAASTDGTTTSTTSTALVCRNSNDPACGPFSFDPSPHNQPITGSLSLDGEARAGQPVGLTVFASDPDSDPHLCFDGQATVDQPSFELPGRCVFAQCATAYEGYGPHDPPPPQGGGDATQSVTLTFPQPGSYVLRAPLVSRSGCDSPYDSTTEVQLAVTVST